jgi:hypothetical protein
MAMDSYYTDRFDKYANDEGVYHVLFSCPRGMVIKEKHRILGIPPLSENRRPCEVCVGEIKDWLASLPVAIRPSQFQGDVRGDVQGDVQGDVHDVGRDGVEENVEDVDEEEDEVELRQEEIEYQARGEIVLPE